MPHVSKTRRAAALALLAGMLILTALNACARKPQSVAPPSSRFTVEFVNAGTQALDPVAYPISSKLSRSGVAEFAVTQLLAGPATGRENVVLFPAGTLLDVSLQSDSAIVNLTGPLATKYHGGADDESAMFKSLVYTLTNVQGVASVQVLVAGKKRAALSGGHFELDAPLTRETFAQ